MPSFRFPGRYKTPADKRVPTFGDTVRDEFGSLYVFLWDDGSSGYDYERWCSAMPLDTGTASEPMLVDLDRLEIVDD